MKKIIVFMFLFTLFLFIGGTSVYADEIVPVETGDGLIISTSSESKVLVENEVPKFDPVAWFKENIVTALTSMVSTLLGSGLIWWALKSILTKNLSNLKSQLASATKELGLSEEKNKILSEFIESKEAKITSTLTALEERVNSRLANTCLSLENTQKLIGEREQKLIDIAKELLEGAIDET